MVERSHSIHTLATSLTLLAFVHGIAVQAQNGVPAFRENVGQVFDQDGQVNQNVRFMFSVGNTRIQLRDGAFSYEWNIPEPAGIQAGQPLHIDEDGPVHLRGSRNDHTPIRTQRIDVELVGARPVRPLASGSRRSEKLYHAKRSGGSVTVPQSTEVRYNGIYPGIDLVFKLNAEGGAKYDLVVHPGADASLIQLRYHGADRSICSPTSLELRTAGGSIRETIPVSYYTSDRSEVPVHFRSLPNGSVGFQLDPPRTTDTLVIDPFPVWGTYFGSNGWDAGYAIATDADGVLVAGETRSTDNLATTGAFQQELAGQTDAFLARFDHGGQLQWCTYFGGSGFDQATSICLWEERIFVGGFTESTDLPTTDGCHQPDTGGNGDGFLAAFSLEGSLRWCTYLGGNNADGVMGLAYSANALHVAGHTRSDNGISTPNSQQPARAGGADAFLASFTPDGVRMWGTYHGGGNLDIGSAVASNEDGIYLAGWTSSGSGIATPGVFQFFFRGGSWDGMLARYSLSGELVWGSYYGGFQGDQAYCVGIADDGIYLGGASESTAYMSSPGAFQPENGGGGWDGFLAKFDPNGERIWGTLYGGFDTDVINGLAPSASGVHVIGSSSSVYVLGSPGVHQPAFAGGYADAFVARFNSSGSRIWGSYYGGQLGDYGNGIAMADQKVLATGYTASISGIAYGPAHQHSINLEVDAFLAEFPISAVGIDEPLTTPGDLKLSPCPADEWVDIVAEGLNGPVWLTLTDAAGRTILERSITFEQGVHRLVLPAIATGSALVTLRKEGLSYSGRLLVAGSPER